MPGHRKKSGEGSAGGRKGERQDDQNSWQPDPRERLLLLGVPERWPQIHKKQMGMNLPYSCFQAGKYLQGALGIKKEKRSSPPTQ